jgi:hypothetical protein
MKRGSAGGHDACATSATIAEVDMTTRPRAAVLATISAALLCSCQPETVQTPSTAGPLVVPSLTTPTISPNAWLAPSPFHGTVWGIPDAGLIWTNDGGVPPPITTLHLPPITLTR